MKNIYKLLSLVLVCIILLSAIPFRDLVFAEDTKADVLLNNFDDTTDLSTIIDQDDLNRSVDASFDSSIKSSENGQSVKVTNKASNSSKYNRARFKISNVTDSTITGFKVWIKNPSQNGISMAYQLINKSGSYIQMKPNRAYYTVNTLGEVSQHLMRKKVDGTNEGCIYIEPGFEGFVYLSVAHGFSSVTANNVSALVLSSYSKANELVSYYIDELSVYYNIPGENWSIRSFSEYETTDEMKNHMMYITNISSAVSLDTENDACVINTGSGTTNGNISFQFSGEPAFNNHTGMKVRMKTSSAADTDMLFKWEATAHRVLKANATYYLVDTQGNIYSKKTFTRSGENLITIPASFDGWLYVPFSSAENMTYSDIFRVYLNVKMENLLGKELSVYNISLYKELPVKQGTAFVINDFEDYGTTQNLKDALVNGNRDILDIELEKNAWGSQGLKMTQVDTENGASVAVNFGASNIAKSFDGFKIRIKTNKNANMLIKSEDNAHRPMKAKALYYLVSSDGRAYSYTASNDSASLVQFAAGFDGWIYIPFASIGGIDLTKMYRVWFGPELTNELGTEFVIDDIVFYSGAPTVINDTPIAFKVVLPYNPENTILDFDSCTTTDEMKKKITVHRANGVEVVLDTTVAQNKNSCKFTFSDDGGDVANIVNFAKNAYFAEITGFRFWIKASDANESVTLQYKLETNEHRPIKRSAQYYLADSNGKVSVRKASADNDAALISIPAGYEGWVYIPFSSIYPMNIEDLYRIWFSFTASKNASKEIWLDSIECYIDNPIPTNPEIINDFDYYSGTADMLIDSAFETKAETGNFSIESAYRDGKTGKSLKIKTVGGGYKFIFSSEGRNEYDGFVFYIKNASKQVARLLPQTDTTGRDSFIPNRAYFIENLSTGTVEMKKFEKVIADAGNIEIPAGFEGYVYLPYSSAYPSLLRNINKLISFWLTIPPQIAGEAEVYVDTISFYKNETCRIKEILVWKQDTTGMLYGFEKSDSVTGYRGWISADERLIVSINKGKAKSGINSLKISTPIKTTDGVKNDWAITSLSLKNEDGTATDVSKYDGVALWLKVERDGTNTKPVSDEVNFGFKVNMPAHGRLYSTSPIYVLSDDSDKTNPVVYTNTPDGCTAVNLKAGFSGMIYIPFSEIKAFSSKEELSTTTLTDIFLMFRFHNLIGYNVYIDDIHGFNMVDLKNVQWPGDPDYNALTDTMYFISTEKYNAPESNAAGLDKNVVNNLDGENNIVLPIVLGSAAVIICVIGFVIFVVIKKKQKNQIPIKANK